MGKGMRHIIGKFQIEIYKRKKPAYTTNKRRNESHTSFGASNRLAETEEKRQVAMNAVVPFEFTRSLDTLPRRCDLDEDTLLLDTNGFVKGNKLLRLDVMRTIISTLAELRVSRDPGQLTFFLVASLSKERRASTSVETRPGIIARISLPNSTS